MTLIRIYFTALILLFFSLNIDAQNGNIEFIENKGQWDSHIKFKSEVPSGSFFIRSTGFSVIQHDEKDLKQLQEIAHGKAMPGEKTSPFTIHSHAYEVEFAGASANYEIIPDKVQSYYNNYFLGDDKSKWASNCKVYQGITLKNVYPDVDVRYYTDAGTMKYDIIVRPGGDISKIVLRYKGADKLEIKNNELHVKTSVGDVKELNPFTYQFESNQRRQVSCKYILLGNEVRFDIKNYNRKETLIIDPTLIFVSLTGSTGSNWGFTATYGPDGSFYSGGVNLQPGFQVSPGAFQTIYGGGSGNTPTDISIMKLSPDGTTRRYATYIGGSADEQPHSIVVDGSGNLILAGRTNSTNYPTTGTGFFGPNGGGGFEIVVTKLNANGTALIGSKKIGGTGDDGVNINPTRNGVSSLQQNYGDDGRSEVILDAAGNIYVASCTRSTNFPALAGTFQTTSGGGSQDGVVLKLRPDLSTLIFGCYLGGNGDDAAYVLSLAPNGEIYVGGGTSSTNFPGVSGGVISSTNNGGIDGFVSIISNDASNIIRSTYLGTPASDQIFGLQFDKLGFPYVTGQTRGSWPVVNALYSNAGAPQFIAKLRPDLSAYVYSTAFGRVANTPNISITAFLVDNCENVYVSGWGGEISDGNPYQSSGTNGLPVTSDAILNTTDGKDFYFFVLKKNATAQLFGSYFGQATGFTDHVDGGTSRFDKQGVIYQAVCANCGGVGTFPTTPGAAYPVNGAAPTQGCNLGMIKISFDFDGVHAGLQSSINGVIRDTVGCLPLKVDFTDTVANAVTYYWDFGDGSPGITTSTANVSHTYNTVGKWRVRLIAEDLTTCNSRDTAYLNIIVGDQEAVLDFNHSKLDPCQSLRFQFDNTSVAYPGLPFTSTSFIWDFGDSSPLDTAGKLPPVIHAYPAAGSYSVKMTLNDDRYCNDKDVLNKTISVAPLVEAKFATASTGCVPYTAQFLNLTVGGQTYKWDFGDGSTSTAMNPSHVYNSVGTYTIKLIAYNPNTCNLADSTTRTINLSTKPTSNFSFAPVPPVENTPITFTNLASSGAINFKWIFGDGDSLLTNSKMPVDHQYNATGTFDACLIAINSAGCADTVCKKVEALVLPLLEIPNAFTPTSNDINSKIYVKGFGVVKFSFIIWNRLGQKVFETNDINIGWDGKYRGLLQPMDVYVYTIDAVFFDGYKTTKKGDITLLR